MKKRMVLTIDYDDTTPGKNSSTTRLDNERKGIENWVSTIEIRKEPNNSHTMFFDGPTALAHEVGHSISNFFKQTEPHLTRLQRDVIGQPTPTAKLKEEVKAWEIGEKVAVTSGARWDENTRQEALGSYKENIDPEWKFLYELFDKDVAQKFGI